ncbi:creatininase family protein [Streptomyces antarcticus]|uniref:creatininase family protein n=1 Tax=Streptomyces antarcticus TaxID=2996458 RepID=UPI00226EC47A|nr:creatininase family protein [Streptomyces sp. H34-AA3]MCY0945662.1 creatininase family protein [Streptomyces sp. H34-AA3]
MTGSGGGHRHLDRLTAADLPTRVQASSVLCLPVGSTEQHGPHLPLATDTVIAEEFTRHLIAAHGETFDLWQLPAVPYGIAPEHAWAPGTLSLAIAEFTALLHTLVAQYARATKARHLVLVNGHGGNRSVLAALVYELRHAQNFSVCVLHPLALAHLPAGGDRPEIHAGLHETALMLHLAQDSVHLDQLADQPPPNADEIRRQVTDRGVSWPWTSNDPLIAAAGIIGNDPRTATPALGARLLEEAVAAAVPALEALTGRKSPCPCPTTSAPSSSATACSSAEALPPPPTPARRATSLPPGTPRTTTPTA